MSLEWCIICHLFLWCLYKRSEILMLNYIFRGLEMLHGCLICQNKTACLLTLEWKLTVCISLKSQAGGKAGKDSGKAKAKAVSRSQRAGLQVSASINTNVYYVGSVRLCVLGLDLTECDEWFFCSILGQVLFILWFWSKTVFLLHINFKSWENGIFFDVIDYNPILLQIYIIKI